MTNFICNGDKYIFQNETIALPVVLNNLPDFLEIENYKLLRKDSFHVSLVCIGKYIEKYNLSTLDLKEKIIVEFCDFTQMHEISVMGYTDELRLVKDKERCSLVAMCNVSNLREFFNLINEKYNLNLETTPTHATLYTLQPNKGIFLVDSSDVINLSKIVSLPQLVLK